MRVGMRTKERRCGRGGVKRASATLVLELWLAAVRSTLAGLLMVAFPKPGDRRPHRAGLAATRHELW